MTDSHPVEALLDDLEHPVDGALPGVGRPPALRTAPPWPRRPRGQRPDDLDQDGRAAAPVRHQHHLVQTSFF